MTVGRHAGVAQANLGCRPVFEIALGSVGAEYATPGTELQIELTVEAVRHKVAATVVKLPFFNPKRKTTMPV